MLRLGDHCLKGKLFPLNDLFQLYCLLIDRIDQLMVHPYFLTIVKNHEIHFFPTAILRKEPQVLSLI